MSGQNGRRDQLGVLRSSIGPNGLLDADGVINGSGPKMGGVGLLRLAADNLNFD